MIVLGSPSIIVLALTFSPNGELLASSSHDCTIKLWNVVTQSKPQTINGHSDGVIDLAFVRDGLTLVSAGLDYFIRFWPIDQQVETNSLGDDKRTGQIAFTDDKTVASLRDGTICLWELETGASKPFSHEAPQDIECFAVSRGGLLAMKVPHAIEIWDVLTRTKRMALKAPSEFIAPEAGTPLVLSRDGHVLVLGGRDATISVWDLDAGTRVTQFPVPAVIQSLALNRDGSIVATACDEKVVRLWDTRTGREIRTLIGPIDTLYCVAFSPDDTLVAAGGFDNTVRLWQWQRDVKPWREFSDAASSVFAVVFTEDNHTLFSGDGFGVRVWDTGTWEQRFRFQSDCYIYHLVMSNSGTALVGSAADGPIAVWRFATEQESRMTSW